MKKYLVALLIFLLSGCNSVEQDENIIRFRLKEDPTTLDPAFIVDVAGGGISGKLYNGLVRLDQNSNIIPDIAKSWDITPDGLIYSFKIRSDVKFTDGTELKPEDIKESFERVIELSPRRWIFDKVSQINVTDSDTLQIKLKEPFSPFLSLLTMPNAYISKNGEIGTGPYKVKDWEHDRYLLLEGNPLYFGEKAKCGGIEYIVIPEDFTALSEFNIGNLDIIELSPIQWLGITKEAKNKPKTYEQIGLNIYYVGFNCNKPYLKDVKIRQALNYAIDKDAIIESTLQGQAKEAWGPVPPSLLKTSDSYFYEYLPNKARKILRGTKFNRSLRLYVRAQTQAIQIAEVIQYYLKEAGINVEIVPLEWSAFKKAVNEGEPDIFLMSWWADYPDPENFMFPTFHSVNKGPGGNRSQFSNKKIDKLIEEAQSELDPLKREEIYRRLQRYINRQAPWIFLWHTKELIVVQPDIKGFKMYPVYNCDKGTDIEKIT